MPTQRFLNLKEEKKKVILEAAVHEFSRVPYSSASINQIIKEADISRGSFYTYFEDKDDLMRYLLWGAGDRCQQWAFRIMEEEKGNVFAVPIRILSKLMDRDTEGLGYKMYQNMLSDLNLVNQHQLFGVRGFLFRDDTFRDFIDKVYLNLDKSRFPMEKETLSYVVEMSMMLSIKAITLFYKRAASKEDILTVAGNEMHILEKGACSSFKPVEV